MATKRKRDRSDESAELALLHIEEHNPSPSLLQQILTGPLILFGLMETN